jgi:hypothetical protein
MTDENKDLQDELAHRDRLRSAARKQGQDDAESKHDPSNGQFAAGGGGGSSGGKSKPKANLSAGHADKMKHRYLNEAETSNELAKHYTKEGNTGGAREMTERAAHFGKRALEAHAASQKK